MIVKIVTLFVFFSAVSAQSNNFYKICARPAQASQCQALERDDSRISCETVTNKLDCALKLARNEVDLGVFSEEEVLLLSQLQPNSHRVIASIRNVARPERFAFEAVTVVLANHTGGAAGLRNGGYCHPGFDQSGLRWSPRVLKAFERKAARTDTCAKSDTPGKTFEELEVSTLSNFFRAACRPGRWSLDDAIDARLKTEYPNLCALCTGNGTSNCSAGYTYDMGMQVAPVDNNNRHVQALECLTRFNGTVAYVAWQHVREYFMNRRQELTSTYALLCENDSLISLTAEILNSTVSPCAWIQQPWSAVVGNPNRAANILSDMRSWWPDGSNLNSNSWQFLSYNTFIGGINERLVYEDSLPNVLNYNAPGRNITTIDNGVSSCMDVLRWCTISDREQTKCNWIRNAMYTLGVEPYMSCQQRPSYMRCLEDIKKEDADFIAIDSNFGYLARKLYQLSPVILMQNSRSALSRVAALVRHNANITHFGALRDRRACFPEYGGIAFVSFVQAGHNHSILNPSECNYAKVVSEFFSGGTCAPGATDVMHQFQTSNYNASSLCSLCKPQYPTLGNWSNDVCAADWTNMYYGNNGTLACLGDQSADVVFVEVQNLSSYLSELNLQASTFRPLCAHNGSLGWPGVPITDECLLSLVIDSEVLSRRNDPRLASLTSLLRHMDSIFGYGVAPSNKLIDIEIYSPFDGAKDLLFKDTVTGLTVPSNNATFEAARNYFQLFQHLESCTGSANGLTANGGIFSVISLVLVSVVSKWIL